MLRENCRQSLVEELVDIVYVLMKEHADFNPLDYYNRVLSIFWSGTLPSHLLCKCRQSELGFEQCPRHISHQDYAHLAAVSVCNHDLEYDDFPDSVAPVEYHEVTSQFHELLDTDDPMRDDSIQATLFHYVCSTINSITED